MNLFADQVRPRRMQWQGSRPDRTLSVDAFDQYIKPVVDTHPNIEIIFFVPPVSPIRHGTNLGELLSRELVLREKLAELADQKPNVSLYAFDDYEPLVTDSAHYRDDAHYSPAVGRWILERMIAKDQRFAMTGDTIRAQSERVWKLAIEHVASSSCTDTPEKCGQLPAPD